MSNSPKPNANIVGSRPETTLMLLGGGFLRIEGDVLSHHGGQESMQKLAKLCCGGLSAYGNLHGFPAIALSKPTQIPLYNILYAEAQADNYLVIDYAQRQGQQLLKPASLRVAVNSATVQKADAQAFVAQLLSLAYGASKPCKRAYVLVNPYAGQGGALKLWKRHVQPIFAAARMTLTVESTSHAQQAIGLVENLADDIAQHYDAIICCSGDGLPHEVFNGLARRRDARKALSTVAVAHVPCGSGNAMSCNLYGTHHATVAALAIVKGIVTPLDLVSITQAGRPRMLSFLSQAVGIIAESDLATEHLRWMGGSRFTFGLLQRMLIQKSYPCDLAVKVRIQSKEDVKSHYKQERLKGQNKLPPGHDATGADRSKIGLQAAGSHAIDAGTKSIISSSSSSEDDDEREGLPALKYGTVEDKVPNGWEVVQYDKLGNFYCGNMSFMAPATPFFSAALPCDGLMDLVCIDSDIPRQSFVSMMMDVESGKFFDNPLVSYRKIEAFRITPRNQKDGYISVDGERIPFEPFQAEVHRGLGRVLSKHGRYEAPGPLDC